MPVAPYRIKIEQKKLPNTDVHFSMVEVKGGEFLRNEKIKTQVSSFFIGQHLVSQELWEQVMGTNPSYWQGKKRPVENISWYDCIEFCNRLSEIMNLDPAYLIDKDRKDPNNQNSYDDLKWLVKRNDSANGYRLPTEAEWEFAARGGIYGSQTAFSGNEELDKVGWYDDNSFGLTHVSGLKMPNELGIYDLSGNLWEWCEDWRGSYPPGPLTDPIGPESGSYRVLRGGSWYNTARDCGVGIRRNGGPDGRGGLIGFRLSRTGPVE